MKKILGTLKDHIEKLEKYFLLKSCKSKKVTEDGQYPLFETLHEPSADTTGWIIEIKGGHTREFNWKEEVRLNTHLIAAGFGDTDTSKYL